MRMYMQEHNEKVNPKDLIGIKKVPLSLIPPASKIYQAMAMKDGAIKYEAYNWREKKVRFMIDLDAIQRHLDALLDGEDNAIDSGLPHLAHALACLGILVDAKESGNLIDDRPTAGPAPQLLERFREK